MARSLVALAAALLFSGTALAQQAQPPLRLVVGFPPGGGIDLLTRVMGEELGSRLGRVVVVENRTGAGGNIAADIVAKAAPDGNTLGSVPAGPLVINRHLYRSMPFDPLNDLAPEDDALVGEMIRRAAAIARERGFAEGGYRTVFNCNRGAGQSVWHIHLHVLGGRRLTWPPG